MTGVDVGLLLFRAGLVLLLAGHATQKLFGWWHGAGLTGTGALFEQWGFRPGPRMALMAGVCELLGAGSIGLGLLTPGGCAITIGTMIVAASTSLPNGLWAARGGCEVPVVYAGIAAALAFTGPGRFSLDHAVGLTQLNGVGWGIAAVMVGAVAAVPPLLRRRVALRTSAGAGAHALTSG